MRIEGYHLAEYMRRRVGLGLLYLRTQWSGRRDTQSVSGSHLLKRCTFTSVANSVEIHARLSGISGVEIKLRIAYGAPTDYYQGDHDERA